MQNLDHFKDLLEDELNKIQLPSHPAHLYEPIRYILALGGKRIRPAVVLLANEAFGGKTSDALPAAIAIEVFHNFTLMHDDIMDQAPLRRGKTTVHEKWNTTVAILSGDAMMVKAYEYIALSKPDVLPETLALFNRTAREVCEGQQLDMDYETQDNISIADYIDMISLKTAVLLGSSMKLGALSAGAGSADQEFIYTFGLNLGIAFQLQDDLLDCYADKNVFGKQVGGDILANKKTYLLLKALELAKGQEREQLLSLISDKQDPSGNKVERVKRIYSKLGADIEARHAINSYTAKALQALEMTSLSADKKQAFYMLAESLLERQH